TLEDELIGVAAGQIDDHARRGWPYRWQRNRGSGNKRLYFLHIAIRGNRIIGYRPDLAVSRGKPGNRARKHNVRSSRHQFSVSGVAASRISGPFIVTLSGR